MTQENQKLIWYAMAQCWVDHPLEDTSFQQHMDELDFSELTLRKLNREVRAHVCGGFALFTVAVFISAGMALPDWYFAEEEVDEVMAKYQNRKWYTTTINPIWWIGKLLAQFVVSGALNKMKKALKAHEESVS